MEGQTLSATYPDSFSPHPAHRPPQAARAVWERRGGAKWEGTGYQPRPVAACDMMNHQLNHSHGEEHDMVASPRRPPSDINARRKELSSLPLGRPPLFHTPVTISPFTADKKLLDAIQALQRRLGLPKAEICRRAMTIGLKAIIADIKREQRDDDE